MLLCFLSCHQTLCCPSRSSRSPANLTMQRGPSVRRSAIARVYRRHAKARVAMLPNATPCCQNKAWLPIQGRPERGSSSLSSMTSISDALESCQRNTAGDQASAVLASSAQVGQWTHLHTYRSTSHVKNSSAAIGLIADAIFFVSPLLPHNGCFFFPTFGILRKTRPW